MTGKDERVGNDHVLSSSGSEHDDLCDVVWCQRLAIGVDSVGFGLVAVEAYDRELGLDLTGIDLHDPDTCADGLPSQRIGITSDRRFRGTVDAASRVGFAAGDTPDIDNVASTSVWALLVDGKHCLGHVD